MTLSPSREFKALVCGVGEQHELMCNTTETFLRWTITLPKDIEIDGTRTFSRSLAHSTLTSRTLPLMVNSTTIHFTRTSSQQDLPLISTLLIDHVTEGLNGTVISCIGISSSEPATLPATVTVHIIDLSFGGKSQVGFS